MDKEQSATLYHYCSLNTFLNIMKNKSIWVSDIERSNDFLELVALRQLFSQHINADFNEIIEKNRISDENLDLVNGLWTLREDFMAKLSTAYTRTFAFCLSEKGDLLSQWRGYADDGTGVAIGFNLDFFKNLNKKTEESIIPIIIDFDKVFVHIFQEKTRKKYNIERLWK